MNKHLNGLVALGTVAAISATMGPVIASADTAQIPAEVKAQAQINLSTLVSTSNTKQATTEAAVTESPVLVSDLLTQNNVTTSSAVILTWKKAKDNKTPQNELKYSLYMSENNCYNAIEDWENNATLLTQTNDIDSFEISGLNNASNYYFKLIVEDTDENKTTYETEHRYPITVQVDKTTLINKIESAKQEVTYAVVGTEVGNFAQADVDAYKAVIAAVQAIANSTSATQDDINNAYEALQQAKRSFYCAIITGLISDTESVSENTNFDQTIQVKIEGTGDFVKGLSADNIKLGGDFTGLTIKSVTLDASGDYKANVELAGDLKKSAGFGTITVNGAGWNGATEGYDITCL